MTVRYRCWQSNDLPPVWIFLLSADERYELSFYLSWADNVLPILKIRMLISENTDTDYCFTVQIGNKSLINRHKFEEFLNQTTSL